MERGFYQSFTTRATKSYLIISRTKYQNSFHTMRNTYMTEKQGCHYRHCQSYDDWMFSPFLSFISSVVTSSSASISSVSSLIFLLYFLLLVVCHIALFFLSVYFLCHDHFSYRVTKKNYTSSDEILQNLIYVLILFRVTILHFYYQLQTSLSLKLF